MGFFDFISILHSNFFIYSKYDEVTEKSDIDDLCFRFDKPDGIPWLFFLFPFHLQLGQRLIDKFQLHSGFFVDVVLIGKDLFYIAFELRILLSMATLNSVKA